MQLYRIDSGEIEYVAAESLVKLFNFYKEETGEDLLGMDASVTNVHKSKWPHMKIYDLEERDEKDKPLYIQTVEEAMNDESLHKPCIISSSVY